jgi:hypothetical protein
MKLASSCNVFEYQVYFELNRKRGNKMKFQPKTIAIVVLTITTALLSLKVYAATPNPPKPQEWTPGCVAGVPEAWGTFRGASAQSGLAFEDASGTIRFLTNVPCSGTPIASLTILRTVEKQ